MLLRHATLISNILRLNRIQIKVATFATRLRTLRPHNQILEKLVDVIDVELLTLVDHLVPLCSVHVFPSVKDMTLTSLLEPLADDLGIDFIKIELRATGALTSTCCAHSVMY